VRRNLLFLASLKLQKCKLGVKALAEFASELGGELAWRWDNLVQGIIIGLQDKAGARVGCQV